MDDAHDEENKHQHEHEEVIKIEQVKEEDQVVNKERTNSFGIKFISQDGSDHSPSTTPPVSSPLVSTSPRSPSTLPRPTSPLPPTPPRPRSPEESATPSSSSSPSPPTPPISRIFDHFIVVGLPPTFIPSSSNPIAPIRPEVLFQFPSDSNAPSKASEFCFPSLIMPTTIKRTPSCSQLNEIIYAQPYLHHAKNSHIFVLTLETATMYGVCVTRMEFIKTCPNFITDDHARSSLPRPLPRMPTYMVAPRCYCILSRYPCFPLHYDAILTLLAQDRVISLTKEMSVPIDQLHIEDSTVELTDSHSIDIELSKPLIDILVTYYNQESLRFGQSMTLQLPGQVKPRIFYNPTSADQDECNARLLADWALVPLCMALSLENIMRVFSAVLQESRVVFVASNLNLLSACVLSMVPLIYPFTWQGIFVPVLPHNLQDVLDAPVPFLVGVAALRKVHVECLIVDLAADKVTYQNCDPPPALPEHKKLYHNLKADHAALHAQTLQSSTAIAQTHNPFNNTPQQIAFVRNLLHTIQAYMWWLVNKVEAHYQAHPAEISDSMSVEEFKLSFLAQVSPANRGFIRAVLDTQHFSAYLHSYLGPNSSPRRMPIA